MKHKRKCCICGAHLKPQALVKVENISGSPYHLHGEYVCRSQKKCDKRREENESEEG